MLMPQVVTVMEQYLVNPGFTEHWMPNGGTLTLLLRSLSDSFGCGSMGKKNGK